MRGKERNVWLGGLGMPDEMIMDTHLGGSGLPIVGYCPCRAFIQQEALDCRTGISEYYRPIPEIDHWLRSRVRMCYWKQWRYARTKVRELLKLGTYLRTAILVAISRKGPWHLARTLATQTGMTNQWLKDQGLVSVKELWVNTCPAIVFDEGWSITPALGRDRFCEPL